VRFCIVSRDAAPHQIAAPLCCRTPEVAHFGATPEGFGLAQRQRLLTRRFLVAVMKITRHKEPSWQKSNAATSIYIIL
jgi:hypothetical protein